MKTYKQVKADIAAIASMRGLVETYEEMAATKMQAIRSIILASRAYYTGLAHLSDEVGADLTAYRKGDAGEAIVLLSANEGLYGDILDKVFADFVANVRTHKAAVFVAGKVGKSLLSSLAPDINYTGITLPDGGTTTEQMTEVIRQLVHFSRLTLYYGEFVSIAHQRSNSRTVSAGEVVIEEKKHWDLSIKLQYFYEPNLDKIAKKFNDDICAGVLQQTIEEGQLAQYASRLMHLDGALSGIDKETGRLIRVSKKLSRHINGKKQQMQYASIRMHRYERIYQ